MAVRDGMGYIISAIRQMVDDAGSVTFTDEHIQDVADRYSVEIYHYALDAHPTPVPDDMLYLEYTIPYSFLEEASSGSTAWRIYDASGSTIDMSAYSVDYQRGVIRFTNDQHGSARYLYARRYDPHAAAAALWLEKAAAASSSYDFAADGAKFNRAQYYQHCLDMARLHQSQARPRSVRVKRSDING